MVKSKKRLYTIITLLLILVIVIGACIFITPLFKEEEDNQSGEQKAELIISDIVSGDINQIDYYHNDSKFSFSLDNALNWKWEKDTSFPISQSYVDTLISTVLSLQSTRKLTENDIDINETGLNKPEYVITLQTKSKTEKLIVGKLNEFSSQNYLKLESKEEIYMGTFNSKAFKDSIYEMIQFDEIPSLTTQNVKSYTVENHSGTTQFDDETHITSLSSMYLTKCVDYNPSKEKFDSYLMGERDKTVLKVPYTVTTEITNDDNSVAAKGIEKNYTFTLTIGGLCENDDTLRYVQVNSSPAIYLMNASLLKSIIN